MGIVGSPILNGGDTVQVTTNTSNIDVNRDNIALNALRSQINAGWAYLNMVDGIADEYEDETGIDAGNTTAIYDSDSKEYRTSSNASLLIQSDTTDGSVIFTDSATGEYPITANGNVEHSTTQKKFGTTSISFDGTGDYLSLAESDFTDAFAFGSGDFTVDFWAYANSSQVDKGLISLWGPNDKGWEVRWGNSTSDRLTFLYSTNGTDETIEQNTTAISTGAWHHIAVVRDGNTLRTFIDGANEETFDLTGITIFDNARDMSIGTVNDIAGSLDFDGYMDEIRIVKGTAEWTTSFTPPTSAYATAQNVTVQSITFTAESEPDTARVVLLHENTDSVTLNTDVIASISRDGGTTFDPVTLVDRGQFSTTVDILSCTDTTLTSTGTSMVLKIETFNTKAQSFHGHYLQWG